MCHSWFCFVSSDDKASLEFDKIVSSSPFYVFRLISKSAFDDITLNRLSFFSRLCFALSLSASLSVSLACPCFIEQLHPVPFNKIKPNRKHSEEINSGLQRLGHPFGLTAAAKTQCLQLFYTVRQPAEWIKICELFLSITTRWEWNWQIVERRGSAKMRWVCCFFSDTADTLIWPLENCCETSRDVIFILPLNPFCLVLKFPVGWLITV